jgi:hypothetical protein
MKTLPTKYNGITFRSRTEARWAVLFDLMGVKWIYENEGYSLSNGEWYLPDFYFPLGLAGFHYAEVKPFIPNIDTDGFPEFEGSSKFYQFSLECGKHAILLDGAPDLIPYYSISDCRWEWEPNDIRWTGYQLFTRKGFSEGETNPFYAYMCEEVTREQVISDDNWGQRDALTVACFNQARRYQFI